MKVVRRVLLVVALVAGLVLAGLGLPASAQAPHAGKAECRRTLPAYPELDPGDRAPAVRTLQCAINDLGFGPVVVDGYYGPQTKKALKKLVYAREGQPPHPYRLTPLFWSQLYGLQLPDQALEQGDTGAAVKDLQRALRAYGYPIVVDGDFGAQTTRVLKEYQERHRVKQTGRTDEPTLYFLKGGDYY
jgi:peptidoglycan hydrolase-like protein with peptidoglycan-binding domain